jgi:CBS domain-containing protein
MGEKYGGIHPRSLWGTTHQLRGRLVMAATAAGHNVVPTNPETKPAMATSSPKTRLNLQHVRVGDVMHHGIISVPPDTPMSAVAELMATRGVHAVAVVGPSQSAGPWTIASALDVVGAVTTGADPPVEQIAGTEVLTVSSAESLDHAARLMTAHELSHLIVTDPASGQPTGVLSTLDLVAAVAA